MVQVNPVLLGGAILAILVGYVLGHPRQVVEKRDEIDASAGRTERDVELPRKTERDGPPQASNFERDLNSAEADAPKSNSPSATVDTASDSVSLDELQFDWRNSSPVEFADVGGMDDVKRELTRDVVQPLTTRREAAAKMGIPVPNILLYGPPGTGKTHLAKALASELDFPWVHLSGPEIQSKWINESASLVNSLFDEAKQVAELEGGAVIFLDELDSVLKARRAENAHKEDEKVVNQFLSELQQTDQHPILFIGATNREGTLDSAATRSGRIDKTIEISLPDHDTRTAMLQTHLDSRPHTVTASQRAHAAEQLGGATAADIESIVIDTARRAAIGRHGNRITWGDLQEAIEAFKRS